jgi:chorismate dehydratase
MPPAPRQIRIGCVSFLNARPLIDGLDGHPELAVRYDVPSGLLDDLLTHQVDMALCPVIDFQTAERSLAVVPVGGIGCNGPTLTVRLFSRVPFPEVRRVLVDCDSHTSIMLMRIILRRQFGLAPEILSLKPGERSWHASSAATAPQAMLLIGDKVVTAAPSDEDYPHQLDLGVAWKRMTGRPFVFAVWMALPGTNLEGAPATLDAQRRLNAGRIERIVAARAAAAGWPDELARQYLGELLRYAVGPTELEAMQLFWHHAFELGLIPHLRPLVLHGAPFGVQT